MNSVEIIGNLVRDPVYKEHEQEERVIQIAKYTIAASRQGKKNEADFISCTAFGNAAVYASKYMSKGDLVAVEGNLHSSAFTDKNGEKHFEMCVYVNHNQNYTSRKNKENQPESDQTDETEFKAEDLEEVPFV